VLVSPTGLLDTSYIDPANGQTVTYGVQHLPFGMGASFLAGNISGLLGVGGGNHQSADDGSGDGHAAAGGDCRQ
jgi:hypothetical protein